MTSSEQERGRPALGRALLESEAMSPDWAPAFEAVPRSAFLPDLIWPHDMETGQSLAVDKASDPKMWQGYADSNIPIVTQWDDGRHSDSAPGQEPTSSASMPSVVFSMLRALDVLPGSRVLEVGTGTGWNAALLAHRLGEANVITVEVDEAVAASARAALGRFGLPAKVVHGDGFQGYPEGVPYDRIIATCGLRSIPFAWVEQSRPDGVIVAPWGTHFTHQDAVARLVVSPDGAYASGLFTGPVEFMKLRAQRRPPVTHAEYVPGSVADGDETSTEITEEEFVRDRFDAHRFALGLRVPDCCHIVAGKREGARPVWFYGLTDRSWACAMFRDGAAARVWQGGPRRLWDEAEEAHRWWVGHGEPDHSRFGLTVSPQGHQAWLDKPSDAWPVRAV
ncbi:methyltransferase domain-containing protein [Streptomyces cucumeris]|uniref:methyltransferase domain-containing protein n=1 Tax=Streptomyces cucumeris TaxID=2962890 RepID=UPI003D726051